MSKKSTSFSISKNLIKELDEKASDSEKSKSEVVERSLKEFIEGSEEVKELRYKLKEKKKQNKLLEDRINDLEARINDLEKIIKNKEKQIKLLKNYINEENEELEILID
ncbi:MAG: hypothetical protein BTN85_0010 [Candidatus Methanohalarchaeum thermophilum]|uniref:Ribbon-helix-helix protein CopG domain-containing protein n=1 Tax=Methanohalarchaeum thermophilum TaxID=1903181 RepID=A0A1Q6DT50_METT1|nr:MAG: hypothetical protein BTN85_0010 [Candidatus Methanohalarchaeum thermophilum]